MVFGLFLWSAATALTGLPCIGAAATSAASGWVLPMLLLSRGLMGLASAAAMPSVTATSAQLVPAAERASAVAGAYSLFNIGETDSFVGAAALECCCSVQTRAQHSSPAPSLLAVSCRRRAGPGSHPAPGTRGRPARRLFCHRCAQGVDSAGGCVMPAEGPAPFTEALHTTTLTAAAPGLPRVRRVAVTMTTTCQVLPAWCGRCGVQPPCQALGGGQQ
jgi:hypothetical protein